MMPVLKRTTFAGPAASPVPESCAQAMVRDAGNAQRKAKLAQCSSREGYGKAFSCVFWPLFAFAQYGKVFLFVLCVFLCWKEESCHAH